MKTGQTEIRLAHFSEVPDIQNIERAAASLFSKEDIPADLVGKVIPASDVIRGIKDELLLVAATQTQVVGFLLADLIGSHCYIEELNVLPEYGRQGIGRRLVEQIIQIAQSHHCDAVTLTTFSHVPWNGPFYETLGFKTMQTKKMADYLADYLMDQRRNGLSNRIAMIKTLAPGG